MIKINLATKKQAITQAGAKKGMGGLPAINLDLLKGLPIRKVAVPLLIAGLASEFYGNYKTDELALVDTQIVKVAKRTGDLEKEIAKLKSLEATRIALDENEAMIRTKLETIRSLIADRTVPPKLLHSLSDTIPKNVWLSDFSIEKSQVQLRGVSLGFSEISDFMKSLEENAYFKEVALSTTQQVKDASGLEVATFELKAKRR